MWRLLLASAIIDIHMVTLNVSHDDMTPSLMFPETALATGGWWWPVCKVSLLGQL